MAKVNVVTKETVGIIKPMHAVNNGPIVARGDQTRGNEKAYKAARIPYARNHDASFNAAYGGEHTVDIYAIFPNFDADPYDPASYDFDITDHYCKEIQDAGTKVYYRLGSKIEHTIKKYNIWPPKDYQKWAIICEHIIAHYTEGWANGFHWDIEYWEIWNEPDLDGDDAPIEWHRCWCGTAKEFYKFFRVAATHLKKRFPNLKIGGPAIARPSNSVWIDGFFKALTEDGERVPLDFFSWHIYSLDPHEMELYCHKMREVLDKYGYTETESILNEWNYVRGWTDEFVYSVLAIIGAKGAAFNAAAMAVCQNTPLDMLMYYDARPSAFNGLFEFYTLRPLKGYWPFYIFADLYELKNQVKGESDDPDVYVVASANEENARIMISYFAENDESPEKEVSLSVDLSGEYTCYLTDESNTMEKTTVSLTAGKAHKFTLKPQSMLYLEMVK